MLEKRVGEGDLHDTIRTLIQELRELRSVNETLQMVLSEQRELIALLATNKGATDDT